MYLSLLGVVIFFSGLVVGYYSTKRRPADWRRYTWAELWRRNPKSEMGFVLALIMIFAGLIVTALR